MTKVIERELCKQIRQTHRTMSIWFLRFLLTVDFVLFSNEYVLLAQRVCSSNHAEALN